MGNTITILITTRYYPTVKKWGDVILSKLYKPDGEELDLTHLNLLDFSNIDNRKSFNVRPSIKFIKVNNKYEIYVAPCLKENALDDAKHTYLNTIIETAKNNDINWYDNFFLVSHDKDFVRGKNVDNFIVPTKYIRHLEASYPCLRELISKHHVYLFQHGDNYALHEFIDTTFFSKPEEIKEEQCNELWKIISSVDLPNLEKMLDYFRNSDNDPQKLYPEIEQNCYPK